MSEDTALTPLTIVFDAALIRAYGGLGENVHADEAIAREWGFPGIIAWGTLTAHPFAHLMECAFGPAWLTGGSLDVRLRRAVCAGDSIEFSGHESPAAAGEPRLFELQATSSQNGVVATARATVRRDRAISQTS
jgi:acyl dehydratase